MSYVISLYATVWNNDRYYLVGWSDKRQKVVAFRIDRMEIPKQMTAKRVPPPEDFDIRDYTDKVFWMYDGEEEVVMLRCKNHLMDQMIDKFGETITVSNIQEDTFDITVPVHISGTFQPFPGVLPGYAEDDCDLLCAFPQAHIFQR